MLGLLRSAPRWPLAPRDLGQPRNCIACGLRLLQSTPSSHSALPPPIGWVDFIGFDGTEYAMEEPSPDVPEHLQDVVRKREARHKEEHDRIRQHPCFQPLIRVSSEVPELELAGALVNTVKLELGKKILGNPYLCGGNLDYVDPLSGEEVHSLEDTACGSVSITLSPPMFLVTHKEARVAEEANMEFWEATEAELDEVVCTSPYFKLYSTRHYSLEPAGIRLPETQGRVFMVWLYVSCALSASQVSTEHHVTARFGYETTGPRWKTTRGGSCCSTEIAACIRRDFSRTFTSTGTCSSPVGIHDSAFLGRAVYATASGIPGENWSTSPRFTSSGQW